MGGEYSVYPVREERGAELVRFRAGVHEEDLCFGVPGEEVMVEGSTIHKEHVRGKPIGALTRDHVIVPILHQKLVDGLCHQMVTEVDPDMHHLVPFRPR